MDDNDQQFSLRWHNHQNSVLGALSRMYASGELADVTLSANGATVKAHKLVLASCSQYFAQLFKDVESDSNSLVVIIGCESAELKLLLTFMYTGEVTASKTTLPSLLRLAQTLKVSGLTDANSTQLERGNSEKTDDTINDLSNSPLNLELTKEEIHNEELIRNDNSDSSSKFSNIVSPTEVKDINFGPNTVNEFLLKSERDRLSKLDQIVQNLYSTHKIKSPVVTSPTTPPIMPSLLDHLDPYERKWRMNSSVCNICNKRLSNQYNLRVHMETHAGRRHACLACSHVSRSKDALRKHVAYRHAPPSGRNSRDVS